MAKLVHLQGSSARADGRLGAALRWALLSSRLAGFMPLAGLLGDGSELRVQWRSLYTVYYAVSMLGSFAMSALSVCRLFYSGFTLSNISNTLFYTPAFAVALLQLRFARGWPAAARRAAAVERRLPALAGAAGRRCSWVVAVVLVAGAVEHSLSIIYSAKVAAACHARGVSVWETYFTQNMPWIYDFLPYSLWNGLLVEAFNIQATYLWSFSDLLIMVFSVHLAEHFTTLTRQLRARVKQSYCDWELLRSQYTRAVGLVALVNARIGPFVVTTFASNLFWICVQLYNSLNKTTTGHVTACKFNDNPVTEGLEHAVYFTCSFAFLATRAAAAALLAGRVPAAAAAPAHQLHRVPRAGYSVEVQRFLEQVRSSRVALSGMDFFPITRGTILSLLGTIVTYELVLLQFNITSLVSNIARQNETGK